MSNWINSNTHYPWPCKQPSEWTAVDWAEWWRSWPLWRDCSQLGAPESVICAIRETKNTKYLFFPAFSCGITFDHCINWQNPEKYVKHSQKSWRQQWTRRMLRLNIVGQAENWIRLQTSDLFHPPNGDEELEHGAFLMTITTACVG